MNGDLDNLFLSAMCPQPTSEGINNLGCFLDKMKWHEMKHGSKLMMTWVTIVPEREVSDAPEIFYPLPLGKTSTEKKRFLLGIARIT